MIYQDCLKISNVEDVELAGSDCACVKGSWGDCGYCDCGLWLKLDIVDIVYIVTVVIVLV